MVCLHDIEFTASDGKLVRATGLSGPVAHAFLDSSAILPNDELFPLFAGWYAEHEEIFTTDIDEEDEALKPQLARWIRRLHDEGWQQISAKLLAGFLGEKCFVATARREEQDVIVVVDTQGTEALPQTTFPLTFEQAFQLYVGRRLLQSFNPDFE